MKRSFLLLPAIVFPLSAQLRITEVMSNSNHSGSTNADGDWFEITNTGASAVDVGGYSFDDDDDVPGASGAFPDYILEPGSSMIILDNASSEPFRTLWDIDPSIRIVSGLNPFPGLGAGGDRLWLYNSSRGRVDNYSFGSATEGFSFARFNNGQSVFPDGLSSNGIFGAYESSDEDEDVGSPGISNDLPGPLPPFFRDPFNTAVVAGSSFSASAFRVRTFDPNGDGTTHTLSGAPAWLGLDRVSNGVSKFTGMPGTGEIGSHTFEVIATDDTDLSSSQTYRIDVLPASSPIILNEYNAVGPEEFLNDGDEDDPGAPFDPFYGRIEGNGGAWAEFVITQNIDLRGWTLTIESNEVSRILKLSDHVALSNIPAGTILTFSEGRNASSANPNPTSLNRISNLNTSGFAWSNIWMHDPFLIDQENSTHPANPAIGSDDARFVWSNASDQIIYGPSGESIALSDTDSPVAVGGTETFRLEVNPTPTTTPLNINYDDGNSSSFGTPNRWSSDAMFQSFHAYLTTSTPPQMGLISSVTAVRGGYEAEAVFSGGATITALALPDFIDLATSSDTLTLTNNRPLTIADMGTYEVTIQADNGAASNNLSYLVFELEVLHPAPSVILNEYNAVASDSYLNGGTANVDEDGVPASLDSQFGRIVGNGGNWFELAVVGDDTPGTANLTNWSIEVGQIAPSGKFESATTIVLSDAASWSSIPHGTLLTFIEKNTAAGGLDTEFNRTDNLTTEGYAWSNIHLGTPGVITGTNLNDFRTNSSNSAFVIKDSSGLVIFGPAGEGIAPLDGVGNKDIFELENDPSSLISPVDDASDTELGYDDGSSGSTFGSPNLFAPLGSPTDRPQDFTPYIVIPSAFDLYLAGLGLEGAQAEDDSDLDGFSNLNEYLYGGNPADSAITPVTTFDGPSSTLSINVRTNDPAYSVISERSSDLQTWLTTDLEVVDEVSDLGPDFVLRKITYSGTEPRMFIRASTSN